MSSFIPTVLACHFTELSSALVSIAPYRRRSRTFVEAKRSSVGANEMPPDPNSPADVESTKIKHRERLAEEVTWVTVSVDDWLGACMPGESLPDACTKPDFEPFSGVNVSGRESLMYPGLVRALSHLRLSFNLGSNSTIQCNGFNAILGKLDVPQYTMRITGEHSDRTAPGSHEDRDHNAFKPDLAMYSTAKEARETYDLPPQPSKKKPGVSTAQGE